MDPDFQRVNITGEDNTGVPVEDLQTASTLLVRALAIRQKYMQHSHQEFPTNVNRSDSGAFMRYLTDIRLTFICVQCTWIG